MKNEDFAYSLCLIYWGYSSNVALLDIIDIKDKFIVGSSIGFSCKAVDFTQTLSQALSFRNASPLVLRNNNGSQFKANITQAFVSEHSITQEFGSKHHPDSQAYIESHHSNIEREFVCMNTFYDSEDVYLKYLVYLDFYINKRPHGSLNYLPPALYKSDQKIIHVLK